MRTAAIICEYNPFHNGHKFHIEETKRQLEADAVIAIMSGNFVQRGDAAIFDKHLRAKAAVLGGADLVLELPAVYSSASAEFFAKGAVKILDKLGIVDFLSFGSECADKESILKIAKLLENEPLDFSALVKNYLKEGRSYPTARTMAVKSFLGESYSEILLSPNNILGIEYVKALISLKSSIKPFAVLRKGAAHDSLHFTQGIASASFIRDRILNGEDFSAFVPYEIKELFKDAPIHSLKAIEKAILLELIKTPADDLKNVPDISEGLENRIKTAAMTASTLDDLLEKVKTKRYTHSRIRHVVLSAFLGVYDADRKIEPAYIKVLDYNGKGQKLIAAAKKTATLPIVKNTSQVNKLKNPLIKELWEKERTFDKIYEMTEI